MTDLENALVENRAALSDFLAGAERCDAIWRTPRAPGKWSPSQTTEHVARALEEAAHQVAGEPTVALSFPAPVRPLLRALVLRRVLRGGYFPRARTTKALDPQRGPSSPAQARPRLEEALGRFERVCREHSAPEDRAATVLFGRIPVVDYVRFQAAHIRHHRGQLPVAG